MNRNGLVLALLVTACFSVAARIDPWFQAWRGNEAQADMLTVLLGDGRRLFANHYFVEADVYFHSGFYPTIFDNRESYQTPHIAADSGAMEEHNTGEETTWNGPPRDWIDRLGRHMYPSVHTHLDQGGANGKVEENEGQVREVLPWLLFSATLDPNRVQTYTVAAFWLRTRMHRVKEAEQFLRQGLRANPDSYEILYELGAIHDEDHHNPGTARHIWQKALQEVLAAHDNDDPDRKFIEAKIASHLSLLEEEAGNIPEAIRLQQFRKVVAGDIENADRKIKELQSRIQPTNSANFQGLEK